MKYGRPAICPSCSPKTYFGVLVGYKLPMHSVVIRKWDTCPTCGTPLVEPPLHSRPRPRIVSTNVLGDGQGQGDG